MNFAEQLRRAEQLDESGSLVIINPPSTILLSEPSHPEAFPENTPPGMCDWFVPVRNDQPNIPFEVEECMPMPTEEFARQYLATMMGWPADKITNITIPKNGMGWDFNGNLIVDKPRTFVRYTHDQ